MDLNDFQEEAVSTAVYPMVGRNLLYPAMGLADEAGEVVGKIKKLHRDEGYMPGQYCDLPFTDKVAILKEIGDVLWYCAVLTFELDANLNDVASINLRKLQSRKERGTLGGSGDDR